MAINSKLHTISIITSEFPPLPGGIGNHAYMLSKYLQKNGYVITVLSDFRSEEEDLVFDAQQAFKIVRIKRNPFTYFNRVKKGFALVKDNAVVIASGKFSLWLVSFLRLFFGQKKYIAVLHGTELRAGNLIAQRLTKWSLKQFDSCVAVSNFTKNVALSLQPHLSIEVINNGIESETKEVSKTIINEEINLVTVGNLTFRKGQQNVIKALPLLRTTFPKIHYHCIGIPTEIKAFSALADALKVTAYSTFHGALSEQNKNEILKDSSVFVMLSDVVKNDFEGFGIAVLEANALGIPAIGSENSGIADAIKNNFSGILISPHEPEAFRKALVAITDNYSDFSSNALAWSSAFHWDLIVQKYINVIEQ